MHSPRWQPLITGLDLNFLARADLHWWALFLQHWNGISCMPGRAPDKHIFTNASGNWGCGAVWAKLWLQIQWPTSWLQENIAVKELVPIVAAAALWGPTWQGSSIMCHCDNTAVVSAIRAGRAKFTPVNWLLRCLFFFAAHYHFSILAQHIPGHENAIADAISRNYHFLSLHRLPQHPSQYLNSYNKYF